MARYPNIWFTEYIIFSYNKMNMVLILQYFALPLLNSLIAKQFTTIP